MRTTLSSSGTSWRIWDLHVHTPESLKQGYGPRNKETWDRFINELEDLPKNMTVVGINDYWFLDGYRKVLEYRSQGRLQNLEAIFPVIELRLEHFGGTSGSLSRVNAHVIFDPELSPEAIEGQFINALGAKAKLSPVHENADWSGGIDKESMEELGQKIKESVPVEQLKHYGSDLEEGFNNLNVTLDELEEIRGKSLFRNKTLLGLGKTEWNDIKWNDQSIAAKKNIINRSDVIFSAFEDTRRWAKDVEDLKNSNVTHQLLDCSDAHYFADSTEHIRLGESKTWINSSPTLAGLRYALREFDRRVFVGLEPSALAKVQRNPENYITELKINSDDPSQKLFDYELSLNPGFVAVVGNKGQGKSALLDCIALAGNSSRYREFAFLNSKRFLSPYNLKVAERYQTQIRWASDRISKTELSASHDPAGPVLVEYLPQAFVERVCNVDPMSDSADDFEKELREILFTHIPEKDRSQEKNFDSLLESKTEGIQATVEHHRSRMRSLVSDYIETKYFQANNKLGDILQRIELKNEDLEKAQSTLDEANNALEELTQERDEDDNLIAMRRESAELEDQLESAENHLKQIEGNQSLVAHAFNEIDNIYQETGLIRAEVDELNSRAAKVMPEESPSKGDLLTLTFDMGLYEKWVAKRQNYAETLEAQNEQVSRTVADLRMKSETKQRELAEFDTQHERSRQHHIQARQRVATIMGDENIEDSLLGLQKLRRQIESSPESAQQLKQAMLDLSASIYQEINNKLAVVEDLYSSATDFIAESTVLQNAGLEFNADLRILPAWTSYSASLHRGRTGDLSEWLDGLPERVDATTWDALDQEIQELLTRLEHEGANVDKPERDPSHAIKTTASLENFLVEILGLSWLDVRFGITGDGKPLVQLSPGQRGLVLNLFYLVVDQRTTPLLLDQPEENLDNETIAEKLVPAIHEAATRRQTMVVTHNANLAVVGDADQIIHCQIIENRFTVTGGNIAETHAAQYTLNVLEGTKPAFDNRSSKYAAFPELA